MMYERIYIHLVTQSPQEKEKRLPASGTNKKMYSGYIDVRH